MKWMECPYFSRSVNIISHNLPYYTQLTEYNYLELLLHNQVNNCSGQNLTPSKMTTRVLIFQLRGTSELSSEVHAILGLLKILYAPRFPPLWRLQPEPSSSSNRSPLMPADNYRTLLFFTFITCNVTQRGVMGWWIFLHAISTNPTPLIATVTICKTQCSKNRFHYSCGSTLNND